MDWRSIGSSFTPSLEAKESHTSSKYPFEVVRDDVKPPKYDRHQYVVGIPLEYQEIVLDTLHETTRSVTGKRETTNRPLAIPDVYVPLNRYYGKGSRLSSDDELVKRKVESFKELSLDHSVTPSLDVWLQYIRAKAAELIAIMQHNDEGIPEWMLARITEEQEVEVALQNCELLCKLSGIVKRTRQLEWRGINGNEALAYMFTIVLFYKKFVIPDFNDVLDAVKWIKTWSNDYIRINDLRHELPVDLHQTVSTEPLYWEYISGVVILAKMPHNNFLRVAQFFMNHLHKMSDMELLRDKIEKSVVVLLTECILPRLFSTGHYALGVNLVRHWLAYNLFHNNSCANFGNLSKHYLLHSLAIVQRECCVDKGMLMDLCDAVDSKLLETTNDRVELGYLKPLDYCTVEPIEIEKLPIFPLRLSSVNTKELLFRVLELFGSESLYRVSSWSKWYNFVKSVMLDTDSSKNFRILLLLHAIIARPSSKTLADLLIRACNSKDISKKILHLHMNHAELWESYASSTTNISDAQGVYKEAIEVFPDYYPLLVSWVIFSLEHAHDSLEEAVRSLRSRLNMHQHDNSTVTDNADDYDDILRLMIPSHVCAAAIAWTLSNKHVLHESHYRAVWRKMVEPLNECEMTQLLKVVCHSVPPKSAQKLADFIVSVYGNNEIIVALYVTYSISKGNKPAIKRLLTREHTIPLISLASRHIERFASYARGAGVYDCTSRLMLLSRSETGVCALRSIIEGPMPFNVPKVRVLLYILANTPKTCDRIQLVSKNCAFSKALWLILVKHLPASSEIMIEEMRSYGVMV
ncbi:uncharacterized protein BXIN_2188 [Babesia sp. Xinjiang]|uniref:uncharacterized protein n=1 Tax=Babesia sp. Xinjiang TaxID=462227 RepID=UPI000A232CFA|nr:uncharacterized protein BXIN_2188 [Babesia sp. Xinjiang]ORM40379.1 hypothetical protein BXIN_2188 [Babesia sp. Xinjiang]